MLAVAIDTYSVPMAVPTLSPDVLGYFNSAWPGTAFLLSFALGLLIWPRLCRSFGYKFSFVVALEAFSFAASRAASAKTAGRLIAMRAVSGAGAGGTYGLFDVSPPSLFDTWLRAYLAGDLTGGFPDGLERHTSAKRSRKIYVYFPDDVGRSCGCQSAVGWNISRVSPEISRIKPIK